MSVYTRCNERAAAHKASHNARMSARVLLRTNGDTQRTRADWWQLVSYGGIIEESAIARPTENTVFVMLFRARTQAMILTELAVMRAEHRAALADLRKEAGERGVHLLRLADLHHQRGLQGRWYKRRDGSTVLEVVEA